MASQAKTSRVAIPASENAVRQARPRTLGRQVAPVIAALHTGSRAAYSSGLISRPGFEASLLRSSRATQPMIAAPHVTALGFVVSLSALRPDEVARRVERAPSC